MHYTEFGAEARKQMLLQGVGLTALAKELNISATYLCEIFKGTRTSGKYTVLVAQKLNMADHIN